MSDEEFSEPFEDDGGEDYVPPVNDEESDIEDVRLGERIPIEKEVEVDSDEEEDLLTEVENTTMPPLADVYHSPDSTVWNKIDEEEDLLTEVENTTMPPLADVYHSPDSTVWNKTPLPSSQTRSYNIIRESGGPNRITTLYTRTDTFNALVTPEMKRIIIRESNRKANQVYYDFNKNSPSAPKLWKPITYEELDAFFGILLMAGMNT
ncbi:Transposase IS4 [Popillia japonica]|uniref:Transposase IS4 n=1 Tax=Popillia japonica TaxID=7064 RepID=A0AAW1I8C5_POPJA